MAQFDLRPVLYVIGFLLIGLAAAMLLPMLVDLGMGNRDWISFALSAAVTVFVGMTLVLMNRAPSVTLTLRQTFLMTTLAYVVLAVFAAIPLMASELRLDFAAAFFEASSGITSTGSTNMVGLDFAPPGILLWRSIMQWLGGIGVVALGMLVLPFLRVGGMQMFRTESSDKYEKAVPRVADLARSIGAIYLLITTIVFIAYALAGMGVFDAFCHALTTVSTGGYSTRDASIAAFSSPSIEWVAIFGMTAGALPFARYLSALRGQFDPFLRDTQVRNLLLLFLIVSLLMTVWRLADVGGNWLETYKHTLFNVVSVVTTTGYASTDYGAWGGAIVATFLMLTVFGGCTGSTTGGIKMFRFEILFMMLKVQLTRLYSPNRVVPLRYAGRLVDSAVMLSVVSYLTAFLALVFLVAIVLGGYGLDLVTAFSGALTAIANVGPGIGPVIGPTGNFSSLPDGAKLVLGLAMILGRLEFFTVLVLFSRSFWRS